MKSYNKGCYRYKQNQAVAKANVIEFEAEDSDSRVCIKSRRNNPILLIGIAAIIALMMLLVFVLPNVIGPQHPEHYDALISVLGQPLDKACEELNISMEDLVEIHNCRYKTPLKAEYAGTVLEVHINLSTETKNVDGFSYYNEYHQNREKAVKDTHAIIQKLMREFGNGENKAEQLENLTEDNINALFDNILHPSVSRNVLRFYWDLTDSGDRNITEYLNELSESKRWQDALKYERLVPAYRIEFVASNEHINENADVGIYYGSSYKIADYTEESNLWDRFLAWING